ncbi:MAG: ABC transporter permease [Planctomycetota bacterium]
MTSLRRATAEVGAISRMVGGSLRCLPRFLGTSRKCAMLRHHTVQQLARVGGHSVGIVVLVVFVVGAVISMQIGPLLRDYGVVIMIADVAGIGFLRELGPMLTAVVLSGYAGASIAAELGTMKVGEEIDALRAMAIDPFLHLVVPRILACIVMTTCLSAIGDASGVLGGLAVGTFMMGIDPAAYLAELAWATELSDLISGLAKAVMFGGIVGGIACRFGLAVRGGADAVGRAATQTIVWSIVTLILADLLFTIGFYAIRVG